LFSPYIRLSYRHVFLLFSSAAMQANGIVLPFIPLTFQLSHFSDNCLIPPLMHDFVDFLSERVVCFLMWELSLAIHTCRLYCPVYSNSTGLILTTLPIFSMRNKISLATNLSIFLYRKREMSSLSPPFAVFHHNYHSLGKRLKKNVYIFYSNTCRYQRQLPVRNLSLFKHPPQGRALY
jgi:hypothetical protein